MIIEGEPLEEEIMARQKRREKESMRIPVRLDRKDYTLEEALNEISNAEMILDGMGAAEVSSELRPLTLWGRIASLRK